MQRIILTSNTSYVASQVAIDIGTPQSKRLAFINTAAEIEEGDKQWLADDRQSLIIEGFEMFDYTITGKIKLQLQSDLASADILYLSGGSTFYLLQQSNASGFSELVKDLVFNQGKVYIGTSAGAIIAGPVLPAYLLEITGESIATELADSDAYNLVNFTVLPHWGSPQFKQNYLESNLETIYSPFQPPTILLTDYQYIKIEDKLIELVTSTVTSEKI